MTNRLNKRLLLLALVMVFAAATAVFGLNTAFFSFADGASAKITGVSVGLDGGIILKFHTDANDGDGSYILVNFNDKTYRLEDPHGGVFSFDGVAPHQMGDKINADLYNAQGEVTSAIAGLTVKDNLMSLIDMSQAASGLDKIRYAAMRETAVDLLNYGAAAQNYVGYNVETLANSDLTETQAQLATKSLTATSEKYVSENNTMWLGATVRFDSRVGLTFAFKTAEDNMGDQSETKDYVVTVNGKRLAPVWSETQKVWEVRKKYINVTELNDQVTAVIHSIKDGNSTENDQTLKYSVSSYVAAKADGDEALAALVNGLYKNAFAAVAYSQVEYDAPTLETAGGVVMKDSKGFDYTGTLYATEALPALNLEDYDLHTEVDATVKGTETAPYIADVYTYKINPIRTVEYVVDSCVKVGENAYSPNTYTYAQENDETVAIDYDGGAYTVTLDGSQLSDLRPYRSTLTVLGTATITREAPLALNRNVTIGKAAEAVEPAEGEQAEQVDEKAANITYVNQGTGDGIVIGSGCIFKVLNATLNMVGTQNCASAVYVPSGAFNVLTDGEYNVDNHYAAPVYTANNTFTVDGGTVNSLGRSVLTAYNLKLTGGAKVTLAAGITYTIETSIGAGCSLTANGPIRGREYISYGNVVINGYAHFSSFSGEGAWGICRILGGTTTVNGYLRVAGDDTSIHRCRVVGGTFNVFCPTSGTAAVATRRIYVENKGVMNVRSNNANGLEIYYGSVKCDVLAGGKLTIEQRGANKTAIWGGDASGGSNKYYIGVSGTLVIWNYNYAFGAWNSSNEVQMWNNGTIIYSGNMSKATLKQGANWGTKVTTRPSDYLPPL